MGINKNILQFICYIYFAFRIGLDGEDCLLRAICEIAETPMHIESKNGVLENIVHFVFT